MTSGRTHAQPLDQSFRPRVVTGRLQHHQVARERRHALADPARIDAESAVGRDTECAGVEQRVQLDGDPRAVRLVHAEADRAERRCQKRRVHGLLHRLRQRPLVHEVLQRPETGRVGLGLFDRAVGVLELLSHRGVAASHADVVRAEAVHQLVHEDVGEECVERDLAPDLPAGSATFEIGSSTILNFASCTFLSITRLVPFSRTTRSSFGRL